MSCGEQGTPAFAFPTDYKQLSLRWLAKIAGLVALMAAKAFGADSVAITDIKNDK